MPPANFPQPYRVDPFSGADESVAISGELHVVPATSPYYVELQEIPGPDEPLYVASLSAPSNVALSEQTYVNQSLPSTIMYSYDSGSEAVLQAGKDSAGNGGYLYRTLINVPVTGPVASAVLNLYRSNGAAAPQLAIYEITSAWDQTTATWSSCPSFNPVAVATFTILPNDNTWYQIDLTTWWNNIYASGTNYGLLITSDEVTDGDVQEFTSARGTAGEAPYFAISTANAFEVVAASIEPASSQVACNYDMGILSFHSDAAAVQITCSYSGTGSLASAKREWTDTPPTSSSSPGVPPMKAILTDGSGNKYLAICVAPNQWVRAELSAF